MKLIKQQFIERKAYLLPRIIGSVIVLISGILYFFYNNDNTVFMLLQQSGMAIMFFGWGVETIRFEKNKLLAIGLFGIASLFILLIIYKMFIIIV